MLFIARAVELVAGGQRTAGNIELIAGLGKILIDITFGLAKCRLQHQVIFKIILRPERVKIFHLGMLIRLIKAVNVGVPGGLILIGTHIGEAQRPGVGVVKIGPRFGALVGARHKAPVRGQQRLSGRLNIAGARPYGAVFKFRRGLVEADPAFIAGVILFVTFILFREGDFIRMPAVAILRHFNGGKGRNVETEHVGGIAGLEIEVGVPGGVIEVGFIFVVIGDVFTVALALPVVDAAG